jgi:hypothetical protein
MHLTKVRIICQRQLDFSAMRIIPGWGGRELKPLDFFTAFCYGRRVEIENANETEA